MNNLKLALKEIEKELEIEENELLRNNLTDEHRLHLKGRISAIKYCLSVIKYKMK